MALKLFKLDNATLPAIADAIRAKTGGAALLLPSQMAAAIGGIRSLRVETGSITPAESMKALDIPCSPDPCAIYIAMTEAAYNEVVANAANAIVFATGTNGQIYTGADGATTAKCYVVISAHTATGGNAMAQVSYTTGPAVSVNSISKYIWHAGSEYVWTAYYWEEDA